MHIFLMMLFSHTLDVIVIFLKVLTKNILKQVSHTPIRYSCERIDNIVPTLPFRSSGFQIKS